MHAAPSRGAGTLASAPFIAPIGVRTPSTIQVRVLHRSRLRMRRAGRTGFRGAGRSPCPSP